MLVCDGQEAAGKQLSIQNELNADESFHAIGGRPAGHKGWSGAR
jgi:hypothetical protein